MGSELKVCCAGVDILLSMLHLGNYERAVCGKSFVSFVVSELYARTIMWIGELQYE
jgi:hypothetical protein